MKSGVESPYTWYRHKIFVPSCFDHNLEIRVMNERLGVVVHSLETYQVSGSLSRIYSRHSFEGIRLRVSHTIGENAQT